MFFYVFLVPNLTGEADESATCGAAGQETKADAFRERPNQGKCIEETIGENMNCIELRTRGQSGSSSRSSLKE